jgi:hypothetical protein
VSTEVTDLPQTDVPSDVLVDHGDQGDALSWSTGGDKRRAEKPPAKKPRAKKPRAEKRRMGRSKRSRAKPLEEESLREAWASIEDRAIDDSLGEPPLAEPADDSLPEPPPAKPEVVEPEGSQPQASKVEEAEPPVAVVEEAEPPVAEVEEAEAGATEPAVAEPTRPKPRLIRPRVTKPKVTKPKVTKPKVTVPPIKEDPPDHRVRVWPPRPFEQRLPPEAPIETRRGPRFRWKWVAAAVFIGTVLAATVMLAMVAAPDLLRERGGPNVSTLSVRAERPTPTSRQFSVTLSNASDHAVVSSCTATVTNPAGTRAVANARFAVGPIPPKGTLSFKGRLKWVGNKSKMAPGISVGCTERSA